MIIDKMKKKIDLFDNVNLLCVWGIVRQEKIFSKVLSPNKGLEPLTLRLLYR